jgi:hypothetical protein
MLNKHVLFYSKYCKYCTEVGQILTKKNLRAHFTMVCVDENRHQIPKFVDCVPMILTSSRQLLKDDDILAFLKQAEGPSIEPMAAELGCCGISAAFAPVDSGDGLSSDLDAGGRSFGYMALDQCPPDGFPRINCVVDDNPKRGQGQGQTPAPQYQQYQYGDQQLQPPPPPPPAFGQPPPVYNPQPPAFGQPPPVYNPQPPAFGQQQPQPAFNQQQPQPAFSSTGNNGPPSSDPVFNGPSAGIPPFEHLAAARDNELNSWRMTSARDNETSPT